MRESSTAAALLWLCVLCCARPARSQASTAVPTAVPSALSTAVPSAFPSALPTAFPTAAPVAFSRRRRRQDDWWDVLRPSRHFGREGTRIAWICIFVASGLIALACCGCGCYAVVKRSGGAPLSCGAGGCGAGCGAGAAGCCARMRACGGGCCAVGGNVGGGCCAGAAACLRGSIFCVAALCSGCAAAAAACCAACCAPVAWCLHRELRTARPVPRTAGQDAKVRDGNEREFRGDVDLAQRHALYPLMVEAPPRRERRPRFEPERREAPEEEPDAYWSRRLPAHDRRGPPDRDRREPYDEYARPVSPRFRDPPSPRRFRGEPEADHRALNRLQLQGQAPLPSPRGVVSVSAARRPPERFLPDYDVDGHHAAWLAPPRRPQGEDARTGWTPDDAQRSRPRPDSRGFAGYDDALPRPRDAQRLDSSGPPRLDFAPPLPPMTDRTFRDDRPYDARYRTPGQPRGSALRY
ncbi:hypothetical protein M885DRAFT_614670 [Pelagophyceae sp. CCMP2097]|nr:hypothetical protein M885DRAFT_614670 [Pelagophyceae sp. CCMP2097]